MAELVSHLGQWLKQLLKVQEGELALLYYKPIATKLMLQD
jgi:hypothetical protein